MLLLQKISTVFWRARVTSELTFILVMNLAFPAIISVALNLRLFWWQAAVKSLKSDMVSYGKSFLETVMLPFASNKWDTRTEVLAKLMRIFLQKGH